MVPGLVTGYHGYAERLRRFHLLIYSAVRVGADYCSEIKDNNTILSFEF